MHLKPAVSRVDLFCASDAEAPSCGGGDAAGSPVVPLLESLVSCRGGVPRAELLRMVDPRVAGQTCLSSLRYESPSCEERRCEERWCEETLLRRGWGPHL